MSQPILAYPGQRVRFTIQNLLSLSTAWVEGRIGRDDEEDDEEGEEEGEAEEKDPEADEEVEVEPPNG